MKTVLVFVSLGFLISPAFAKDDTVRTHVSNGGNSATVVQSGNPKDATVKVERRPGYTRIEQRSGGNSSTIIQSNGSGPVASGDPQLDRLMRQLMQ